MVEWGRWWRERGPLYEEAEWGKIRKGQGAPKVWRCCIVDPVDKMEIRDRLSPHNKPPLSIPNPLIPRNVFVPHPGLAARKHSFLSQRPPRLRPHRRAPRPLSPNPAKDRRLQSVLLSYLQSQLTSLQLTTTEGPSFCSVFMALSPSPTARRRTTSRSRSGSPETIQRSTLSHMS